MIETSDIQPGAQFSPDFEGRTRRGGPPSHKEWTASLHSGLGCLAAGNSIRTSLQIVAESLPGFSK